MSDTLPRFAIVPYDKMDELMEKVEKLSAALFQGKPQDKSALGDYISEKEAKSLLSKGTTWFWNKRQSGELTGRKAGNQWYYSKKEILNLIEKGKPSNP